VKVYEWVLNKLPMKIWEVRSSSHTRLKTIESEHRNIFLSSYSHGLSQRGMITYAEISLIPDEDDFLFFLHFSEQYSTVSQSFFHFFLIEKGRLHTLQSLDSRYCPRSSIFIYSSIIFSSYIVSTHISDEGVT
jgi:hypothetical protein